MPRAIASRQGRRERDAEGIGFGGGVRDRPRHGMGTGTRSSPEAAQRGAAGAGLEGVNEPMPRSVDLGHSFIRRSPLTG